MRANRIFIALLALFFCAAEVRIGQAARQDPQPDKSFSQTSNSQSPGGSPEQRPGGQYRCPMSYIELATVTDGSNRIMTGLDRLNFGTYDNYVDLVSLTVTVTDSSNRLVTGLDRLNFEIYEDKVKQEISFFTDEDAPVNLGIVFDVSESMKGKLDRARDALKAFIQTSHSDDDFFLIGLNQRANLLSEFTDGAPANKLTLVDPGSQMALYDATYLGIKKVRRGRHNRDVLLLISDGQDNSSRSTYGELRKLLKEPNVQIYCIGIAEMGGGVGGALDRQGRAILEEIAQTTGGKAFFPRSSAELEDVTTRIAVELRHQYSIGYSPTNVKRDGQWRKIKVNVKGPKGLSNLKLQYKEGYYAAADKRER
jgi:Ca-activated chloride channel homolog